MIATVLSELVAKHATSVKEIAEITGRGESTVYRWLSGQSEPEFSEMVSLIHSVSSSKVRRALVDVFVRGLPVKIEWLNDNATLVNGSSTRHHHDAMDLAILAMASLVPVMVQQRPTLRDGELTDEDREETVHLLDNAMTHLGNCRAVLTAGGGRRKARPVAGSG